MFSSISWQTYWQIIGVITVLYYALVYLTYFRDFMSLPVLKRGGGDKALGGPVYLRRENEQEPSSSDQMEENRPAFSKENEEQLVSVCIDELDAFFDSQKKSKAVKGELMHGLYSILQKYPSLRHSDYKESLSGVIATQCQNICSIHLSAEELKGVWFG
jgi:hypothetical protein